MLRDCQRLLESEWPSLLESGLNLLAYAIYAATGVALDNAGHPSQLGASTKGSLLLSGRNKQMAHTTRDINSPWKLMVVDIDMRSAVAPSHYLPGDLRSTHAHTAGHSGRTTSASRQHRSHCEAGSMNDNGKNSKRSTRSRLTRGTSAVDSSTAVAPTEGYGPICHFGSATHLAEAPGVPQDGVIASVLTVVNTPPRSHGHVACMHLSPTTVEDALQ